MLDGRGTFALCIIDRWTKRHQPLGGGSRPLYAEKWVPFIKEIGIIIVKGDGEGGSYPAVVKNENVCYFVFAPMRNGNAGLGSRAQRVEEAAMKTFEGEMFLMDDGTHS